MKTPATEKRQLFLLIAAGACFAFFVCDAVLITPLVNHWKTSSAQIEETRKQIATGRLLMQRENVIRSRWDEMEKSAFTKDVSSAEDEILKSSDRWVQASRLRLSSLKPQTLQTEDDYVEVEFTATGQGSLDSVARFLYELETDPLALRVKEVQITPKDKKGGLLTVEVVFSGLLLVEESA